jgi:hypothetical protein
MQLVRVQSPDGQITFHKMANSQIAELILEHLPCRAERRAFNYGGSATVEGWTYKVVNVTTKSKPTYFSN